MAAQEGGFDAEVSPDAQVATLARLLYESAVLESGYTPNDPKSFTARLQVRTTPGVWAATTAIGIVGGKESAGWRAVRARRSWWARRSTCPRALAWRRSTR